MFTAAGEEGAWPASPTCLSHDNARLRHRLPNRLVGQHAGSVEVKFITDYDILAQHGYILHAHLGLGVGQALLMGHTNSLLLSLQAPLTDLPTGPHGSASPRYMTQARNGSGCAHPEALCSAGCTRHPPPPHQDRGSHWAQCCSSDQYGHLGPESVEESKSESFVSQIRKD